MTRIYFALSFIVVVGCSIKDKVVEYYDNGATHKIYYVNNGKTYGEYLEYYKNGNIKVQGNFKKNRAHGIFKEFSIDGELLEIGNYVDDKAVGWFKFYKNGKLKMKRQYILINDQSYINQFIVYDKSGNVVKDSSNYISAERLHQSGKYLIKIEASMFNSDYMEILLGEFNNNFEPINSSLIDTIKVEGKLKIPIELRKKEKAIVCDILKKDSERLIRFLYFDPQRYEY